MFFFSPSLSLSLSLFLTEVLSTASVSQSLWFLHLWPLRGCTASAFVCTFSFWWFSTIAHVEIINFKPCQNHFPHMHGVHSPPLSLSPGSLFPLLSLHPYEARVILFSFQWIKISMWLCYSRHKPKSRELDSYCLKKKKRKKEKCVARTGLCIKKKREREKKGWGFMQAGLAEFPHTSLVTPNIAKPAPFSKQWQTWNIQQPVLLLQHIVKKHKKQKKNRAIHALPAHF